ncbi:MAG: adenosylmethionine--8-amino-7-oxononanoate transaminase [Planctomycetes bacterium]|nr:adenosylmethionine--8-amino-7-oxononanoate transaminase [Planctomycetota bacterium]
MSLESKDKKYLWHPFTQMKDWMADDIVIIERAKGNYLYDTRGRRYLDGISSLWCNVHGHQVRDIDRAIKAQLGRVAHSTMLGLSNVPAIELAEELIRIAPNGLQRVFYSDSGSTAVEIALKMAFQYWQQVSQRMTQDTRRKTRFLTFVNAYHGDTIGSVSLGGMDLFHKTYKPLLFKTIQAPAPYCYRCPMNKERERCKLECLAEAERLIKHHHRELAGVVIEPLVQGAAGMITQPRGFIRRIRQLCTKYDVLMIADEVATGFGRTGRMFACEHEKVTPDIMAVAKGITGGYLPLAATLTPEKIFKGFLGEFKDNKTFFHGHTYTGNPLACAAALANLKMFRRNKTLEKLQPKVGMLKEGLQSFYELKNVGDIRQRGFMIGIELVMDKAAKKPFPHEARIGHQVILEARKHGVILRPLGNVIVLMPPLSITLKELKLLLDATYQSIRTVMNYLNS